MNQIQLPWADFKAFCASRSVQMQFVLLTGNYFLVAFDGPFQVNCILPNDGGADCLDFQNNFEADANKKLESLDPDGNPIFAPTFANGLGLNAVWKGYKYQANFNATNFFDELITTQLKVLGGWYEIVIEGASNKPALGDYIEFSVIDKDDATGLFAYFGLTVGVDILELGKFVRTEMINPNAGNKREVFQVDTPQNVIPGLYFRTAYVSVGAVPVDFKIVLNYYEV